jgi:hypothetical protein
MNRALVVLATLATILGTATAATIAQYAAEIWDANPCPVR